MNKNKCFEEYPRTKEMCLEIRRCVEDACGAPEVPREEEVRRAGPTGTHWDPLGPTGTHWVRPRSTPIRAAIS